MPPCRDPGRYRINSDPCVPRCSSASAGFYFRFLFLACKDSAEEPVSHVHPPSTLWRCSRMLSALATNAPRGLPKRQLWGGHFAGLNFRSWPEAATGGWVKVQANVFVTR